jgi:hypothetical protein
MGNLPWACPMLTRCGNVSQGGTGGYEGGNAHSTKCAEQRPAADAFQPPLVPRFGFQARLRPGVDMTSDVKSREQLF